ncbi:MAG: tail fiber domain-containing protein [Flavobacteriaceae bacterium]|nr:tail fiber domain-containing protein [Flavobacteriaceae bacterium]
MSSSSLTTTNIDFKNSGATQAKATASADTLTFIGTGSNDCKLTGVAYPTSDKDAATKKYVDDMNNGRYWKDAVRVATTSAGILSSAYADGEPIDGVTLATNDRILIKNQLSGTENGIYIVQASGSPVRSSDLAAGVGAAAVSVFVEEGTVNQDTAWVCTNNSNADTVGTDNLTFVLFSKANGLPGGANTQIQYNNNGSLAGASTFTTNGTNVTLNGGNLTISDNDNLYVGDGNDLTIRHVSGNTDIISSTGSLQIDNTNATGNTILSLGDNTATSVVIQNNSSTEVSRFYASGRSTFSGDVMFFGRTSRETTVTTINTAGNVTYNPSQFWGGIIRRDPNGANRSDVTPTADSFFTNTLYVQVGSSYKFSIENTADAVETITLTAGTGVTLVGSMTIGQGEIRQFLFRMDNIGSGTRAASIYDQGLANVASSTPGGSNTQMQYNNNGSFGGLSTLTTNGTDLTIDGGDIIINDGDFLKLGDGSDMTITHNGSNALITNITGNYIIDNVNNAGKTIMRLGTDNGNTSFVVENNSQSPQFRVNAAGQTTVSGNLDVTSGIDMTSDNQPLTIGVSQDLSIVHNGSNSVTTSSTGNYIVDNTNNGGSTIMRLGSDDANTIFRVENNSETGVFNVQGNGQATLIGNLNVTSGIDVTLDNQPITVGLSADLSIVHNGTNTVTTSTTGDYIVDNTAATGSSIMQLGTDTDAVDFQVQNNSGNYVLKAYGDQKLTAAGDITGRGQITNKVNYTTITVTANGTYTAANIYGGWIKRDPNGSNRTDTTPSATSVIALIKDFVVFTSFNFVLENTADADETITLAAGTGVTIIGSTTVKQNERRTYKVRVDSSTALSFIDMGSNLGASVSPGGSNGEMQYNNSGSLGGLSTLTTDGTSLTLDGGNININDGDLLRFGDGNDFTIQHTGSIATMLNTTGPFLLLNNTATEDINFQMGTNNATASFNVKNLAGSAILDVEADSKVFITGTLDVSDVVNFNDTTASSSYTTGALIVDGGVGIAGKVYTNDTVTGVSFTATSDANFKKEIAEIENPLDKIDSINAYQYKFNFTDDDKLRYGVLAQNLKEQGLDDLVFEEENSGRLSVDYNNLVGLLIGSVKELKQQVKDLTIQNNLT